MSAPTLIKLHLRSQQLELHFGQEVFHLPAEYLRVFSPSAEVRGHGAGQAQLQHGKAEVTITHLEAQGNYALRPTFSDGHNSGIYTWDYLHQLGQRQEENWQDYLAQLNQAGKSRFADEAVVQLLDPKK